MKKRPHQRLRIESLEQRALLAADSLVISEFMAANRRTLQDEDGDFSDWIEIHNPTDDPVSMDGWTLTDDAEQLGRWTFPDVTIEAGGYLLVFASGKDRTDPSRPLHTDFRLSAAGEFIGLSDANGEVVFQTADMYPPQADDVAYGLPIDYTPLITGDDAASWLVPTVDDAALEATWVQPDFDDSQWASDLGPFGFDERQGFDNFGFEREDLSSWETSGDVRLFDVSGGIEPPQGLQHAGIVAGEATVARFTLERFLELSRTRLNSVGGSVATLGSALRRTVTVEPGSKIEFAWNFATDEPSVGGDRDFAFFTVSPGDVVIKLADVTDADTVSSSELDRESGYSRFEYTFAEGGEYTIGVGAMNDSDRFSPSAVFVDDFKIDGAGAVEDSFQRFLKTDLADAANGVDSSLWLRFDVNLSDVDTFRQLELRVRFDDGMNAYWDGTRVASDNAPSEVAWNAVAPSDRANADALSFDRYQIGATTLATGSHVLAVQGFKASANDENQLLGVELIGLGEIGEQPVFLTTPTPGAANVADSFRVVAPVQFSEPHGFYSQPFDLTLSTATANATIRYTRDGAPPTADTGIVYDGNPIRVAGTEAIRAAAFRTGLQPSHVETQSYLFVEDVIRQSSASVLSRGFPTTWGSVPVDYAMDTRVIGQNGADSFNGRYAQTIRDDLMAVPTLSLVMDLDDLFDVHEGIYSNPLGRGDDWERPTSVEWIDPEGGAGFQIDAGIRIQGGISRFISSKMSLRLLFKSEYGSSKLDFPFFGPDAATSFDSISLRSSSGEHLVGIHYIRDEFARRSQLATGNVASHGRYMHLYINGVYWGLYNPAERVDGQFAANYYGGTKDDYDVLNAGDLGSEGVSAVAGSLDAWNRLIDLASEVETSLSQTAKTNAYLRLQGLNPDGSRNPDYEVMLDADNFIDYLITQVYVRNRDWPMRNYYMLRRRGPDSDGFKFYVWDAEFTLDQGDRTSLASISREGPGILYQALDTSEAFRVEFSDRVQQHFSRGGAFYVNPDARTWDPDHPENNVPAARYQELVDEIYSPIVGEMARWGDETARNGRLLVRDGEWANTVTSNLDSFFPNRSRDFLADLRRLGFYRDAPEFSVSGGLVDPGTSVELQSDDAVIYYTLDGTDPRNPDGSVAAGALVYGSPLVIDQRSTVLTRSLNGAAWSALGEQTYLTDSIPADVDALRITELNYNPHDALVAIGEPNVDNDEFEFIELANVSNRPIDLEGVQFVRGDAGGVEFTFGSQRLAPGEFVVVPQNREAFTARFGDGVRLAVGSEGGPSSWTYDGRLGNGGEEITIQTATGELIQRLQYGDDAPWPVRADGDGSSLELIDFDAPPNDPSSYRASVAYGGTPGTANLVVDSSILINELLTNAGAPGDRDRIELYNTRTTPVDIGGWFLSDSASDILKYRIPDGTVVASSGFWTIDQQSFGFGMSGTEGDDLYLVASDSSGRPARFVDAVQFGATDPGVTLGRWPTADSPLFPMQLPSFGATNARPVVGDIIVSEIQFAPQDPDGVGTLTGDDFEYVELFNRSGSVIDLGGWRLEGDASFQVPEGVSINPGETLVVAGFDPIANPDMPLLFRLATGATGPLNLVGPLADHLPNLGGTVILTKPGDVETEDGAAPGVLVDRVVYSAAFPWPDDTVETGESLQRIADTSFGILVASWRSDSENPGSVEFSDGIPGDVDGDGRVDLRDIDRLCVGIRRSENSALLDLDRNGQVDHRDFDFLIHDVLRVSAGDANLDGRFNSGDLVLIFQSNEYEDAVVGNSTWKSGDWNCDGDFTSSDLVVAFIEGGYVAQAVAAAVAAESSPEVSLDGMPASAALAGEGVANDRRSNALDATIQRAAKDAVLWGTATSADSRIEDRTRRRKILSDAQVDAVFGSQDAD